MRQIIVVILLALLTTNVLGTFVTFRLLQYYAQSEMKTRLANGVDAIPLEKITANAGQNIIWENEHEFHLNNNIYDVVYVTTVAGTKTYHCINDKKESALLKQLNTAIQNELSNGHSSKSITVEHIFKLLSLFYVLPGQIDLSAMMLSGSPLLHSYACSLSDIVHQQSSPPPELG